MSMDHPSDASSSATLQTSIGKLLGISSYPRAGRFPSLVIPPHTLANSLALPLAKISDWNEMVKKCLTEEYVLIRICNYINEHIAMIIYILRG